MPDLLGIIVPLRKFLSNSVENITLTNSHENILVLEKGRRYIIPDFQREIRWDQDNARVSGRIQKKNSNFPLEISISTKGKKAKFNHLEQKRLSAYIGNLNVILFAPEDLSLVKGSP